jgi:hypothetical protein
LTESLAVAVQKIGEGELVLERPVALLLQVGRQLGHEVNVRPLQVRQDLFAIRRQPGEVLLKTGEHRPPARAGVVGRHQRPHQGQLFSLNIQQLPQQLRRVRPRTARRRRDAGLWLRDFELEMHGVSLVLCR